MVDPDLLEKIKTELYDSGQPLEISTLLTLSKEDWNVTPNVRYFDKLSVQDKEIDIVAERYSEDISNIQFKKILFIECKKSSKKPWVFIKQENITPSVLDLNIIKHGKCPIGYGYFDKSIEKGIHVYAKYPLHSYAIVPLCKDDKGKENGKQREQIFHATNQVLSVLSFYCKREQRRITETPENACCGTQLQLLYPIIVFDGVLLSASITPTGIDIEESDVIHYRVHYELPALSPFIIEKEESNPSTFFKSHIISIVRSTFLESYLQNF